VVVEAAWAYRHRPAVGATLRKRQELVSEEVKEMAWKAQHRLHERYRKLLAKGKNKVNSDYGHRTRVAGFPVGHWSSSGNAGEGKSATGGMIFRCCWKPEVHRGEAQVAVEGHTKRRTLENPYAIVFGSNARF
jgi:hypothetical protein